ncbi:MBL fold metallo-hydrolase, partial [Gammaproteobacteria bacterium]|nr:MBL fold metallo-hydrolase [Gammaproteobacteria bacterium]
MRTILQTVFAVLLIGSAGLAKAGHHEDALNIEQLSQAFGWDLEGAEIQSQKVADGLYILFGIGGNIAVSIGEDGVLIVDDQLPQVMDKIEAAIAQIGGGKIDYAINTHWHFDHAEGNNVLGPKGTTIVAHSNARADMQQGGIVNMVVAKYNQQPYPKEALPVFTYDEGMQIHFNEGEIDLRNFSSAHTNGDTVVIFKAQNAVHMGDVFNNAGYPFIDVDSGGSIDGMINFCEQTL